MRNSNSDINSQQHGLIDLIEGFKLYYLWIRLAWTETKRRYRRTAIGPLWVSLSMLIFSLVLSVVWATLWQQSVKEFLPFLLSGLLAWTFISSCIGESTSTLISAEAVLKNRKFPYSVYTNALITKQLIIFGHNLLVLLIVKLILQPATFNLNFLLFIPGLFLVIFNLYWITLLTATLCLRFRDFQQLITIFLQIIMFITPIFWPRERLIGHAEILVDANLIYHLTDVLRSPLLGQIPSLSSFVIVLLTGIIGNFIVIKFMNKKIKRFVYWY